MNTKLPNTLNPSLVLRRDGFDGYRASVVGILVPLVLALVLLANATAVAAPPGQRIIVKLTEQGRLQYETAAAQAAVLQQWGQPHRVQLERVGFISEQGWIVRLSHRLTASEIKQLVQQIDQHPLVDYAEQDLLIMLQRGSENNL